MKHPPLLDYPHDRHAPLPAQGKSSRLPMIRRRTKAGMIDLYTWGTPNGHKIHIMLEETGLPYRLHKVDIGAKAQFDPAYVKINPNSKIPAIVDQDGPDGGPITI